jgi:AraC-like DNA-binding protein
LLGGGVYCAPRGKDFPSHQHSVWELVYYRVGNIRCSMGDQWIDVQPGALLLNPPHTPHSEQALTHYENIYLSFEASEKMLWPSVCFDDTEYSIGETCAGLLREWNTPSVARDEMLRLLTRRLVLLIERAQEQTHVSRAERTVRAAEHLIRERSAASLCLLAVAHDLGVSPSYLRREFQKQRGCTPRDYARNWRLQRALSFLRGSSLSLEAIASVCGYHSASHLSRHIKQATARTPSAGVANFAVRTNPKDIMQSIQTARHTISVRQKTILLKSH